MKTAALPPPVILYRDNTPRYASTPCSGAGAAKAGGRFNRIGIEALYLSLSAQTALAEFQQTSLYLQPGTFCSYLAELPPLVDLRQLSADGWDPIWHDWSMDWRYSLFTDHLDPPTWDMGDIATNAGYPGIIFPSVADPGGINVVLFMDALRGKGSIAVHDPNHTLPHDDASWR
ncbi:MAG: RES family NAD+ phosphorylase [Rhodanobacter sp.]